MVWDWCGYFGEAGDFCLTVERSNDAYIVITSDGRRVSLGEGRMRCFSPVGVCVEVKRKGKGFKAEVYLLSTQEKLAEVEKE